MATKDPTPKADALRAQREARFGHLQATDVERALKRVVQASRKAGEYDAGVKKPKLIPYAGKDMTVGHAGGAVPYSKNPKGTKPARVRKKLKRKTS